MRIFLSLIITLTLIVSPLFPAYAVQILSDEDLEGISAQGFDINIDAVLNFRETVGIIQSNVAAVSGDTASRISISNGNTASGQGLLGNVLVNQENLAAVVATDGNLTDTEINNTNYASALASGSAQVTQRNISLLIALEGDILNSSINNLNHAVTDTLGASNVVQQNIAIVIAAGVVDAAINNVNTAISTNAAVINSGALITHSFTFQDFTGIISIDTP